VQILAGNVFLGLTKIKDTLDTKAVSVVWDGCPFRHAIRCIGYVEPNHRVTAFDLCQGTARVERPIRKVKRDRTDSEWRWGNTRGGMVR
jgi:hypothetical protein